MNTNAPATNPILVAARGLIGNSYTTMDCSHFVHEAYEKAGYSYPYTESAYFATLAKGSDANFVVVRIQPQGKAETSSLWPVPVTWVYGIPMAAPFSKRIVNASVLMGMLRS